MSDTTDIPVSASGAPRDNILERSMEERRSAR
ncbi:MAG: hypothetical protein RJB65_1067, partial [Actinomycetota bacterium]